MTELLAARLPRGRVVALDGSASMIAAARERLAPFGDRVSFVVADLSEPVPLTEPVDAILSTATFHWIPDHDALFANLAAVLRPGGRLVAQCGGAGNIASIRRILADIGDGWLGTNYYATPRDTARRLDAAGFVDVECWLHDEPTWFEPGEPFETFLRTVILGAHLQRLPADARSGFVRAVVERLPGTRDRLRPAQHPRAAIPGRRRGRRLAELSRGRGTGPRGPGSRRRRPQGRGSDRPRCVPGPSRADRPRESGRSATTGGSSHTRRRRR